MPSSMLDILPTHQLCEAGQSPWIDYVSRDMIRSGKLKKMIQEQGILGLTSNPSIFQNAITQSQGTYQKDIQTLTKAGRSTLEIYDALSVADIRQACDLFYPVYKKTQGEQGYVSLEVLPNLAFSVQKTLAEAERIWNAVNRPNLMVKVPATEEGILAIRELIGKGININVTLIFSRAHYRAVAQAYLEGLKLLQKNGGDLTRVRSVASVFVSRFDTLIDKQLEARLQNPETSAEEKEVIKTLFGKAGVANSKLIYQDFEKIFSSSEFSKLKALGAHVQKVLWGSTSCKNPKYPDLLYVETLVGPETVNTMPQITVDALLDHGQIKPGTIREGLEGALAVETGLKRMGIDLIQVGQVLQRQGVKAFCDSFDDLMRSLEKAADTCRKKKKVKTGSSKIIFNLNQNYTKPIEKLLADFQYQNFGSRLLAQDPTLWKKDDAHKKIIQNRLGWLQVHEWITGKFYELDQLSAEARKEKIKDVVLLGMGGSSLAPEVMSLICRPKGAMPRFRILDSTDPLSVRSVEKSINIKETIFIVASKSGSTIETLSQFRYFFQCVSKTYGAKALPAQIGQHFIAITDPGSSLEELARSKKFRYCLLNPANIGGRYSALSLFGLVPAALMGIPFRDVIAYAGQVYQELAACASMPAKSRTLRLGAALGYFSEQGKDKMTLLLSPSIASFGAWIEQLVAESTGKEKKGIVPVDTEKFGRIQDYNSDRIFIAMRLEKDPQAKVLRAQTEQLKKAGFPVIEVSWPSPAALGGEFLRWEIVTAVASAVSGVNPFDEPNVTESKEITTRLLKGLEAGQSLALPDAWYAVGKKVPLKTFLPQIKKGSYVALLAYCDRSKQTEKAFEGIRDKIRKAYHVPVLLGFGPRYLHSIGQLYKGGTPSGIFIEFFNQDIQEAAIPGVSYGFSQLKRAQGFGDFEAIAKKNLPILAVDLGRNISAGLQQFEKQLELALKPL